jgi:hypothetical protein
MPSTAVEALDNDPDRLIMSILLLRSFARTKEVYDNTKDRNKLPQSRMMDLLQEIEFESIRTAIKNDG